MEIKDIQNSAEEFAKLTQRFKLLHDRLLAIAMDYKYYINGEITDNKIYELRDNVAYRLYSARFHFQLLLEYHPRVEKRLQTLYNEDPKDFFNDGFKFQMIHSQSTKEIYSLFDSMVYHLCSIFDYLCQIINFTSGKEILLNPKWNVLIQPKNVEKSLFCSKELTPILQKFDSNFIYPLIQHRSQLIHTKKDTGGFTLNTNLQGTNFNVHFFATEQFKEYFQEIAIGNENHNLTIKYAGLWLIDKTIKTTTEILFELSEDMKRNRKPSTGFTVAYLGNDGVFQSPSVGYWGDRNTN